VSLSPITIQDDPCKDLGYTCIVTGDQRIVLRTIALVIGGRSQVRATIDRVGRWWQKQFALATDSAALSIGNYHVDMCNSVCSAAVLF